MSVQVEAHEKTPLLQATKGLGSFDFEQQLLGSTAPCDKSDATQCSEDGHAAWFWNYASDLSCITYGYVIEPEEVIVICRGQLDAVVCIGIIRETPEHQ